jgi:hypothetical protein
VMIKGAIRVVASGDVDVTSEASNDATGEAIYCGETNVGVAFSLNYAVAESKTSIEGTTLNDTGTVGGGNVTVSAKTANTVFGTTCVTKNIGVKNTKSAGQTSKRCGWAHGPVEGGYS